MMAKSFAAYVAEFIGTFFLCFAGISAILNNAAPINSGSGLLGIALAHGLALSVAVSALGGVSGAHFNPAVTIAMLSTGRIGLPKAIGYIVSQLAGASVAAFLCKLIFDPAAVTATTLGLPLPGPRFVNNSTLVILVEAVMTFLLLTAIFGNAVDERGKAVKIGGLGIGLTVAFDILAGGPVTGASMNPARSFGPALIANRFREHWMYWVGPVVGAVIAAQLYHHVLLAEEKKT